MQQTQTIDQFDADLFLGTDFLKITDKISMNGFVGAGTFSAKAENAGVLGNQCSNPWIIYCS